MMSEQLLSPTNSMKLKNLKAARKIKNGSPKIREVLRERCRQKMHERRNELFIKRRHGLTNYSQEVKDALTNIVHEEFGNLESMELSYDSMDINIKHSFSIDQNEQISIENETLEIEETMEEQWILEEYQKILWEQKQIHSIIADDIYCPICLKNILQEIPNFVVCNCGLKLPVQLGLQELKENIQEQVNAHSSACLGVPKFNLFQEHDKIELYFSCMSCDIFALV